MRPDRCGVSGYLEAFILIGLASGGSTVVLFAFYPLASGSGGPAVAVEGASIRQGNYLALEKLIVVNTGPSPLSSFMLTTGQVSQTGVYCYSLYNPSSGAQLASTCPPATPNPSSISIATAIPSGGSVGVIVTVVGAAFGVGTSCLLTVTASSGAQQTVGVEVAPA